MPKKPIKNAFYFYMIEFRQNQREKGITYSSMAEVQRAADPCWKSLSNDKKAKYTEMAKKDKANITKQTVIVDEMKEQEMIDAAELQIIKNFVKQKAFNNDLIAEDFFIMDVNSYCYCNFQGRNLIGECTVLRFSVLKGVKDHFHKSINIGQIPIGYAADVKWSCKEYGLEEPAEDQPPTNLNALLQSLIKYMKGNEQDNSITPLYAFPEKIPLIKDFVLQMCAAAGEEPSRFSVYKLDSLFYYLNNEICLIKDDKIPKIAVAKTMLLKDHFWYIINGLGCEKHDDPVKENMKSLECTKSRVFRWTYRILERSCLVAGIDPVVGRHVPLKADDVDVLLRRVKEKREEAMQARGSSVNGASSAQNTVLSENSKEIGALTSWNSLKESVKEQVSVPPSSYNKNIAKDSDSLYGAARASRVNETRPCSMASYNTEASQDISFERDSMASNSSFFPINVRNVQRKPAHVPMRMPKFKNYQAIKPAPELTENVAPIISVGRGRGFITTNSPSNNIDSWDD